MNDVRSDLDALDRARRRLEEVRAARDIVAASVFARAQHLVRSLRAIVAGLRSG